MKIVQPSASPVQGTPPKSETSSPATNGLPALAPTVDSFGRSGGNAPGPITPADVDRIAAMADPVARNYAITEGYSDLSHQTAKLLGQDNASWVTFGTWASRQAGVSIRGEDMPKLLTDSLQALPGMASAEDKVNQRLQSWGLPKLPGIPDLLLKSSAAQKTMSDALAGGNRIVFQEIGREFAVFDQTFQGDTHYDQAKVDKYLAHFTPAQRQLRDGFAAYAKAMFEKDPSKKAQLMLYGNALIGADEQSRLQGYIQTALNCGKPVFQEAISGAINESLEHLPAPARWVAKLQLKLFGGVGHLTNLADEGFRDAATQLMMRLTLPKETLHLGQDLPNPPGQSTPFPPELSHITDPALAKLLGKLEPTPDSLKGSGARDWSSYRQRMGYIVDLFRSRQQDPSLFELPFATRPPSAAQVA